MMPVNDDPDPDIWAEWFQRKLDDIFAVQDEITHNIVLSYR